MEDEAPTISALIFEGLTVVTAEGKPAQFAILDGDGRTIAVGKHVADAAFHTSIAAYRQMLIDKGHIRVYTKAETLALNAPFRSD